MQSSALRLPAPVASYARPTTHCRHAPAAAAGGPASKRQKTGGPQQAEDQGVEALPQGQEGEGQEDVDGQEGGRVGPVGAEARAEAGSSQEAVQPAAAGAAGAGAAGAGGQVAGEQQGQRVQRERRVLAKPVPQGRGHTGYLTFARRAVALE